MLWKNTKIQLNTSLKLCMLGQKKTGAWIVNTPIIKKGLTINTNLSGYM